MRVGLITASGLRPSEYERKKDGCGLAHDVNLASEQIGDRLCHGFGGDMDNIDCGHTPEHFTRQVWRRCVRTTEVQFPGLAFAYSTSSWIVFAGTSDAVTSTMARSLSSQPGQSS